MRNPNAVPERYQAALSDRQQLLSVRSPITQDSVLLWGAPGVGKTFEAVAHARSVVGSAKSMQNGEMDYSSCKRYYRFAFADSNLLISSMRTLEQRGRSALMQSLRSAEVLLLDDIGHDLRTAFSVDVMTELVYSRYNDCLTTIVTSNYNEEELVDRLGPPVVSRLTEMCQWVPMTGKDRREGLVPS